MTLTSPRVGRRMTAWCFAVLSTVGMLAGKETTAPGAAFRDDFNTLDRAVWYISDGWTNGPHQNCDWSERAVDQADGFLRLSFLAAQDGESARQHCGEIQSKAVYHHGTYEARIRTASGSGLNAAFFTYIGPVHKAPHDEIDFEVLTRDTGRVSLNTFVDGAQQNGTTVPIDPPTDEAFHIFSFTWAPDNIRWFIDGREVHRAETNLPVTPQKIFLSLWGSDTLTDWMGPFAAPDGPVTMEVDWVSFTPLGERCQFPESVLCQTP
jgi:endo-1,3-1,4-beta-glycanase ExoK